MGRRFFLSLLLVASLCYAAPVGAEDIYEVAPTFSPYSAGRVKKSVLEAALTEVNAIRKLAGVSDNVTLSDDFTNKAQHGAVLMDANDVLSHTPAKPDDMPREFYELGYEATSHGNIHSEWTSQNGVKTGTNITLQSSLKGWMDDKQAYNLPTVGHRRWILNPRMKQTGFGISTRRGYSVMYVIEDHSSMTYEEWQEFLKWPIADEFIAWPVKSEHPLSRFDSEVPWSVSLCRAIFEECDKNAVSVKLTREGGGTWNFSAAQSDGYFNLSPSSYAYDECIIFRPDNVSYQNGETWTVEISGLKRKDSDESVTLSYITTFSGSSANNGGGNGPSGNGNNSGGRSGKEDAGSGCNTARGGLAGLSVLALALKRKRA